MQLKGITISRFYPKPSSINSLRDVFDTYYLALCFFANKIIEDSSSAEEIVADVFVKLYQKQPDFMKHENTKAVLYISVKNASLNFIKKRYNDSVRQTHYEYVQHQATEDFVLNEIIRAEVLRDVFREIQKLPPQCKKVMELFYHEGLDHKDIAQQLGITVSTVKNQKARGLQILRRKLGPSFLLFFF